MKRRSSSFNTCRIEDILQYPHDPDPQIYLHFGDLTDATSIIRVVWEVQPHEIFNLAAQSHVQVSLEIPEYTANADVLGALGALRLLEAVRILKLEDHTRFFMAATSEMFGLVQESPQTETTPFYQRSRIERCLLDLPRSGLALISGPTA